MINVNSSSQQADAHLLRFSDGKIIMIDVGHGSTANSALIPWLVEHHVEGVDTVFITHPHKDHYGGLVPMLEHNITIGEVYFNLPDRQVCDREIPWGCDYGDILSVRNTLEHHGVKIRLAEAGQYFEFGKNIGLEILYGFDGVHTPVGTTDINDMSLVMLMQSGNKKILFTGDLNRAIGTWLAQHGQNLKADILKVPHHGTESTVPDSFFDAVNPSAGLVPAPRALWYSDRSRRIRNWFKKKGIPVYVNGEVGTVQVIIQNNNMEIIPGPQK